jgi:hypothetical protein
VMLIFVLADNRQFTSFSTILMFLPADNFFVLFQLDCLHKIWMLIEY